MFIYIYYESLLYFVCIYIIIIVPINNFCFVFFFFILLLFSRWNAPISHTHNNNNKFSFLILEGRAGQPKMMSVGLHCRLSRPGRVAALTEFVDYAKSYGREVWITTRESIANHYYENHLPRGCGNPIIAGSGKSKRSGGSGLSSLSSAATTTTPSSSTPTGTSPASAVAASSSSRFSFLGNLKAARNSQEYKDSLKITKTKSDDISDDGEDVI